jgi:hypothetical protein
MHEKRQHAGASMCRNTLESVHMDGVLPTLKQKNHTFPVQEAIKRSRRKTFHRTETFTYQESITIFS